MLARSASKAPSGPVPALNDLALCRYSGFSGLEKGGWTGIEGGSQNYGYLLALLRGPRDKGFWRSILGSPYFGKLPYRLIRA